MLATWLVLLAALLPLQTEAAPAPSTGLPPASAFYVPNMPGLKQDPSRPLHIYAGHLPADPRPTIPTKEVSANLFFTLVKARRSADKERIIFWFNGGPGCSSFDGLMMEVGPWRVDGMGGLKLTDGGWEEYTNIVFVDQPAGTGFSYVATNHYVQELTEVGPAMVQFLSNFYSVFPEYATMETYLAGESFAGQFIPYIATSILESNLKVPLEGLAIGNGWMDGRTQYPAYIEFGLLKGLIQEGSETHQKAKSTLERCMGAYDKGDPVNAGSCEGVMGLVTSEQSKDVDGVRMCVNVYDVRLLDTAPACGMNWPPDLANVTEYLRRKDVVSALHATAKAESWAECNGPVFSALGDQTSPSAITLIPKLLSKLRVMLFAGDEDLICNYVGIERMMEGMTWNGAKGLGEVSTETWTVNGTIAGRWTESRNLTYARVFNASHMVGFDVPHISHDMILRFMGMNFAAISEGSATIPSAVGGKAKPMLAVGNVPKPAVNVGGKTPEQNKAMWEAYYNAGSAALILVLISLAIGIFFFCRSRRRGGVRLRPAPPPRDDDYGHEERIPLRQAGVNEANDRARGDPGGDNSYEGKGKGKAMETEDTLFEVGSDEDEEHRS